MIEAPASRGVKLYYSFKGEQWTKANVYLNSQRTLYLLCCRRCVWHFIATLLSPEGYLHAGALLYLLHNKSGFFLSEVVWRVLPFLVGVLLQYFTHSTFVLLCALKYSGSTWHFILKQICSLIPLISQNKPHNLAHTVGCLYHYFPWIISSLSIPKMHM